jgi:hypothetical protein
MDARQHTAAYVGARCGICPGPPPNPPPGRWHFPRNSTTSDAVDGARGWERSAREWTIQ